MNADVVLLVALHALCDEVRHVLFDHEARGPCFVRLATALRDVEMHLGQPLPLDPAQFATTEKDSE